MILHRLLFLSVFFVLSGIRAQILEVNSPNESNKVKIKIENGLPYYRLQSNDEVLIDWSELGLKYKNQTEFSNLETIHSKVTPYTNTWKPLWEKNSIIENSYNEIRAIFKEKSNLMRSIVVNLRVYDDGIAWRYEIPIISAGDSITVEKDLSSFNLTENGTFWAFNDHGNKKHLGPADISQIPDTVQTPFLFKYPSGKFIAILEAGIKNMANFILTKSEKAPNLLVSSMGVSVVELPEETSWRVVMIGESELDLVESNLVVNLNPPSKISDTSWIKTGISTWNWRGYGYKTLDGYEYGLNTDAQKRFIDFASKNGLEYHLIDANWYGPEFDENSDPSTPQENFNVEEILSYAKNKNVGVFLYLNDVGAKKFGLEKILKQFHEWGAVGIKYGFMKGQGQEKVLYTNKVIELCAKNKLLLFFHDLPIPPSGDHRTWPHLLAREYGHAQADGKYSVYPENSINQPFINMLGGPLDMNFGWFDLQEAVERIKVKEAIPGTVAGELAKMAVIFSGYICIPDVPEEYMAKYDMFDFVKRFPRKFDEYKVISGAIDKYISVARRSGEKWVVASYTNNEEREMKIELDFLKAGKKYKAYLYEDQLNSDYLTNKEAYKVRELKVDHKDIIEIFMAPGGGNCIILEEVGG
tara:strand:+ start:23712 stop:25631 length:1920 start_codon:yes stop_codon:yes gene_type:complete